jgi:hypothetical protein
MKKKTLISCIFVLAVAVFIIWLMMEVNSVKNLVLSADSVEKINFEDGGWGVSPQEISEITVDHSASETTLTVREKTVKANKEVIMGTATTVRNITYDSYQGSLTAEEFNELVNRLNYIFLHAERYFWLRPGGLPTRWEMVIYLNNSETITLSCPGWWINEKRYACEIPKEQDPTIYLKELGYKVIKTNIEEGKKIDY